MLSYLFGFQGRMNRLGWWLCTGLIPTAFTIFAMTVLAGTMAQTGFDADKMRYMSQGQADAYMQDQLALWSASHGWLMTVYMVGVLMLSLISLAATIKRFHDRDKSGLWVLISFVPLIGALWIFIECGMLGGSDGPNRFEGPASDDDKPSEYTERLSGRLEAAAKTERPDFGFGSSATQAAAAKAAAAEKRPRAAAMMSQAFPNAPRKAFGVKN